MKKRYTIKLQRVFSLLIISFMVLQMVPILPITATENQTKAATQTVIQKIPVTIDTSTAASAYSCDYWDQWVPMFPTGQPDNSTTWPQWDDTHYAQVVGTGHNDVGALYMKSQVSQNTAVAINAGMTVGKTYTLGLWARGTAQSQTLFLYDNGNLPIIETAEQLCDEWQYYEVTFTATLSQLNIGCRDWGANEVYLDNITLTDENGNDLLAGLGDFYREVEVTGEIGPTTINTALTSDAYNCLYEDKWVPMFPTGQPDNSSTWPAWDSTYNFAEIVEEGYRDAGALHLRSDAKRNTGIAINVGMIPGNRYTLGLWAKGTATTQSLFSYDNGDFPIIESAEALSTDWQYYEVTFTANVSQLNLCCRDWGANDVYIDNITLFDQIGNDLLAGHGDFWEIREDTDTDANWNFEKTVGLSISGWKHNGILADSTMRAYGENVYSGQKAMRVCREQGQMDASIITSEEYIPVSPGDRIEVISHIASRNSISGHFSMILYTYGENGKEALSPVFGQERITNAGSQWSQWDTYEMTYVVGAGVYYIRVGMRVGGTSADVLIDDLAYYNYTENGNTVYVEDFAEPSVTTGLPGGWSCAMQNAQGDFSGAMTLTGDGESRFYTDLFCLTTDSVYTLTASAEVSEDAEGTIVLEAIDWKGDISGQTVIPLHSGDVTCSFTAASAVYDRLWVVKTGSGTVKVDDISIQKTGVNTEKKTYDFQSLRFSFPTSTVSAGTTVSVSGTLTLGSAIPAVSYLPVKFVQSGKQITVGKLQLADGTTTEQWPVGSSFTANFQLHIPNILPAGSYTVVLEDTNSTIGLMKVKGATQPVTTTSSIENIGGKATFLVNGQPQVPLWYARPENTDLYEAHTVTKFADAGVDTVVSYVFLNNNYGDIWTENGFVSDGIDDMMWATLAGNPDAKMIVALDFNAPQWWLEQNPGELVSLSGGTPERTGASFASEKWKQESGAIMVEAIEYLMRQPYANNIIGFKITGGDTLEWNWWALSGTYDDVGDFSECGVSAFRSWLKEKYQTDSALQQAYGDNAITLANAMPPSAQLRRDEYLDSVITVQDHPQMLDYEQYMAEIKAETIEYFAKLVKETIQDRLVVGTYGGYFYMGGGYEFTAAYTNVYFQKMLQSEYIDFIKSPWMYGLREIGDSAEFMGPADSLDLYGKLWIVEEDSRLNLQEMLENQDDKAAVGWTRNYQQTVEQLKRDYAYVLSKGMGMSFYNLMWNFTDDDQYYDVIGQMYKEMAQTLSCTEQSTAEIAVFVDGQSHMLIPYEEEIANSVLYTSVFKEQFKELGHIGAPYDMYLLDDLKDGLVPEHKINIFLGTTLITEEARAAIQSQLQKNGNILVWVFTDGISDGKTTDITQMEALISMDLSIISTQRKSVGVAKITDTAHWLTDGLQAGMYYGVEYYDKLSPVIAVTDNSAEKLAYHIAGSGVPANQAALAVKDMGNWISVYSAVPNLPQSLIRNMLTYTDSHIYTHSGSDVIYASKDHIALHSIFAGTRTIQVPEGYGVYDVFRDETVSTQNGAFSVTLDGKETRLFRLTELSREKVYLDESLVTSAYAAYPGQWMPMLPAGQSDGNTWLLWDRDTHYACIVDEGCNDLGALYMKSSPYRNTGVAIDAGMIPGQSYTLGLWAKGSSNSGRVLALYANGDPVVIAAGTELTADWSYYEMTFTAGLSQLNLVAADWGNTELYVDNITLKNSAGVDILSGYGDFWKRGHTWKDASCAAPRTCMGCGVTEGEPLPHTPAEDWTETKQPTFTESGETVQYCTVCGQIVNQADIPAYQVSVQQWNVTLGGDLRVTFYVNLDSRLLPAHTKIRIAAGENTVSFLATELTKTEDGCYAAYVHLAAAQMTDAIAVTVVQGEQESLPMVYSVRGYADQVLQDDSMTAYHQLVKDMLHYGAAAQSYFDYHCDNLADSGVSGWGDQDIPDTAEPEITGKLEGIRFYGASLLFQSNVGVRFYFDVSGDVDSYSFTVDGKAYTPKAKDGLSYIEVSDINPQNWDETITVTVNDALVVSYSPMHYMVRMNKKGTESLKTLVKAMYNYYLAAEAFCLNGN